jgi:hypothetical protein
VNREARKALEELRRRERDNWIAYCRTGEDIPRSAIEDHCLTDLFRFEPRDNLSDMFRVTGEKP